MITRVSANKPSFRAVEFTAGLNVVMADRTKESTKKDSRNGLGKSTLLEIISFGLGGKGGSLAALDDWAFTLGLHLGGRHIEVTRAVHEPKKILVSGDVEGLAVGKRTPSGLVVSDADWNDFLGVAMFDLPARGSAGKWSPTYRSLISYFLRRGKDAYSTPFEHFRKQKEWDKQVTNAYLLGLSWEDAQEWECLREKGQALDALKRVAKSGVVEGLVGSVGELEAEKVRLEERAKTDEAALKTFKVHPQYRDIEANASELTVRIHSLSNENIADRNLLSYYKSSLEEIVDPASDEVVRLFEEAGVVLPELVRRRIDEVKLFHDSLVGNRRAFLETEVSRVQGAVNAREATLRALTEQRASLLAILSEHGALEEFTLLQQAHLETGAAIRDLETRIANLKQVEVGRSQLKIEQERLYQRASQDYEEREPARRRSIRLFNGHSEALYAQPGRLVIEVTHAGFKFEVEIERAKSSGIGNMKIFCYDLTLAQIWAARSTSPGFLAHDSLIFDGVDERQVAAAIQRAAQVAATDGFQYICTINSDAVPYEEFAKTFSFDDHVRLRLTDETPEGCLLGIRF